MPWEVVEKMELSGECFHGETVETLNSVLKWCHMRMVSNDIIHGCCVFIQMATLAIIS